METKRKIEVGKVFSAKVGSTYVPVRIDRSLGHGRYEGINMIDGAAVKTSAAAVKGTGQTVEQWHASQRPQAQEIAAPAPTSPALDATGAATAPTSTRSKRGKRTGSATDTAAATAAPVPGLKPRKVSGLDAAVMVLREAGTPLNCGDMATRMLETGLWKTGGKTPANTLYSAIVMEIAKKGDASRFRKTSRGTFELTEVGKEGK